MPIEERYQSRPAAEIPGLPQFLLVSGTLATLAMAAVRESPGPLYGAGLFGNLTAWALAFILVNRAAQRARSAEARLARSEAGRRKLAADLRGLGMRLSDSNRMLADLAATDELTGLTNRRRLDGALARAVADARRDGEPLSVLLLDVDHFKAYNDALGHPAGDAALQRVAELLRATMRSRDVCGRFGGEEFLAILPAANATRAMHIAERLRHAVEDRAWAGRPVTISLGVSTLGAATADGAALVAEADRALYEAKRVGRNQAVHADGQTQPRPSRPTPRAVAVELAPTGTEPVAFRIYESR